MATNPNSWSHSGRRSLSAVCSQFEVEGVSHLVAQDGLEFQAQAIFLPQAREWNHGDELLGPAAVFQAPPAVSCSSFLTGF